MDIQYFDAPARDKKTGHIPKYKIKKMEIERMHGGVLSFRLEGVDEKGESKEIFFHVPTRFIDDVKNAK